VFRPSASATPVTRPLVPPQIQVQPFRAPVRIQPVGFWSRVRRAFFGVTEPEAGA
jgi:hypothetical protein